MIDKIEKKKVGRKSTKNMDKNNLQSITQSTADHVVTVLSDHDVTMSPSIDHDHFPTTIVDYDIINDDDLSNNTFHTNINDNIIVNDGMNISGSVLGKQKRVIKTNAYNEMYYEATIK